MVESRAMGPRKSGLMLYVNAASKSVCVGECMGSMSRTGYWVFDSNRAFWDSPKIPPDRLMAPGYY